MKFKVDENLPTEVAEVFRHGGFDADTVAEEGLQGAEDEVLARAARSEQRVIVTLDTDFGNIQAYPPESYAGIVVLRPAAQDKTTVTAMVRRLLRTLRERVPAQELWIVEPGRIRNRSKTEGTEPNGPDG